MIIRKIIRLYVLQLFFLLVAFIPRLPYFCHFALSFVICYVFLYLAYIILILNSRLYMPSLLLNITAIREFFPFETLNEDHVIPHGSLIYGLTMLTISLIMIVVKLILQVRKMRREEMQDFEG